MKRRIGKIREKLCELLQAAGLSITGPECLWIQEGAYRSIHWDLARWGAKWEAPIEEGGKPINHSIYSWDTMTECVKNGFTMSKQASLEWEIYANETVKRLNSQPPRN